jgi:large subunit ribosomal protein L25
LQAAPRTPGHPNRQRAAGHLPIVVYGKGQQPRALQCDAHAFNLLLAQGGMHHLLSLEIEGEAKASTVVVKEIQHHPVSRRVVHADFQAVSASEHIHAEVPLHFAGEDQVVKGGGLLQVTLHNLRISCLPADLPEAVGVDVSALRPGDVLTIADLKIDAKITVLQNGDEIVASVRQPRAQQETETEAAPATPTTEA